MNRRDRAYSEGATATRNGYHALFLKYRDLGYAAPLGRPCDHSASTLWLIAGIDMDIKMILIDAGWKAGQDKLRADLDERLAEVSP